MKLLSILVCVAAYLFVVRAINMAIRTLGTHKQVQEIRIRYLLKTANIGLFIVLTIVVCLVLGLGYGEVSLFLSSAFAVIGVALFAQWSLLSNITASMVIFFVFPYRVGDRVKVTDADFDLSGTLEEIGLFHVLIRSDGGYIITYPNSMILQKAVIKLDPETKEFPQKIFPPPSSSAPALDKVSIQKS